jgi:hypothetical protein
MNILQGQDMITKEEIDEALEAHAQWRNQLQEAISSGKSEFKVDMVSKDNVCPFGQWLYKLSKDEIKNDEPQIVQHLHAEFHKVAGDILSLALAGRKEEALAKLDYKSEYGSAAGKLILAMIGWKDKILYTQES